MNADVRYSHIHRTRASTVKSPTARRIVAKPTSRSPLGGDVQIEADRAVPHLDASSVLP